MKKHFTYFFLLILFNSCIEEIEFNESSFDQILIVDATLTDEYKKHQIKLQRTTTLKSNDTILEKNAIVTIIDNTLKTYSYTEKQVGVYESNLPFKAELGKQYSLQITTSDGEKYESSFEKIQGINDIDEIYVETGTDFYGEEGLNIFVKSESVNREAKYYKYKYKETYKIIAPRYSPTSLRIVSDVYPWKVEKYYHNEIREICYNTINSINIIQTETNSLSENKALKSVRFIKKNDSITAHRYSIEVEQQVQSYEAYTYLKTLSKLSNSENVFSQSQQGFLQGNISSITSNKKAIGFFEVNSVSKKRIFFNHTDIFPEHYINTRKSCLVYAPPLTEYFVDKQGNLIPDKEFSPLIELLKAGLLYYEDNKTITLDNPGTYRIVKKRCGDCRVYGSNIKPDFWID